MSEADARAYILGHLSTLKLTEKKRIELETQLATWNRRIELARTRGAEDLVVEAEKTAERLQQELVKVQAEEAELRSQIESLKRQLPALAARQRSVDPDLLEQELLMATGRLPGDDAAAETDRNLAQLAKEAAAEAALTELKARLAGGQSQKDPSADHGSSGEAQ
ncbi:MAG: chromosome partitioning protein [Termitinemataceae bacterium]